MVDAGRSVLQCVLPVLYVTPDRADHQRVAAALESDDPPIAVDGVVTVAELRDALAASDAYACVVTEYALAETDALSLYEALRADGLATVPFVLYTADGDESLASEALTAGFAGYVPKGRDDSVDRLREQLWAVVDRADATGRGLDLEELRDVTRALETCSSVEAAYRTAVDAVDRLLESDASAVFRDRDEPLASRVSGLLAPTVVAGTDDGSAAIRTPLCAGLAERAVRAETTIAIEPGPDTGLGESPSGEPHAVLSVPVRSGAVIQTVSTTPNGFDDRAVTLLELVAATLDSAIGRIESTRARKREYDRFAALFESVPDAVVLTNRSDDGRVVAVNPAFEETFGYDFESFDARSIDDLLVPDDAEPFAIDESVGLETVVTAELERLTADGRRDFLFRGFATELAGAVHEYAIYTDLTEQKRRERDLERYRTLVETVGDAMYVLDADGRFQMGNDAMARQLGVPRDEFVGEYATDVVDGAEMDRLNDVLEEIRTNDERRHGTIEKALDNGEGVCHIEDNVAPLLDDDGDLIGSVGVIRDVTSRKERERRIRLLHEGTRRLMAATEAAEIARLVTEIACDALDLDLNSVFLYEADARAAAEDGSETAGDPTDGETAALEGPTASDVADAGAGGLVPVAMSDAAADMFGGVGFIESGGGVAWDAFEAGETIVHGDVRRASNVRNPETPIRSEAHIPLGEHGIFIVSSLAVNDFDTEALTLGRILAANAVAALDRAARERELADRTRELERQNDRLEAFAGTVSHDLRNPLTLASGHLASLETVVGAEGEPHLEEIEWALERMDDLVANVLTLARSGQRLTETEPVDLERVVERAHRTVDADLEVAIDESLPTVVADEARLCVLFENAFRNARDHVGEDVTVTVARTDDGFAIGDDGPGIPPDEREAVLESGYSTAAEGTGFGLAIVAEVVEAHGWSMAIEESDTGGLQLSIAFEE